IPRWPLVPPPPPLEEDFFPSDMAKLAKRFCDEFEGTQRARLVRKIANAFDRGLLGARHERPRHRAASCRTSAPSHRLCAADRFAARSACSREAGKSLG